MLKEQSQVTSTVILHYLNIGMVAKLECEEKLKNADKICKIVSL